MNTRSAPDENVIEQAIAWRVCLESGTASPHDHDACTRWRSAHADHEMAWQALAGIGDRVRTVPASLARRALHRPAVSMNRRAALRSLLLLGGHHIGTIAGLPAAIAVYFWANRLLPTDLPARAAWEAHAMFLAWALMFAHAWLRPATRAWIEQWTAVAVLYALLPIVNAWTTAQHLGNTLPQGDWVMAGFDLTMLALGITAALIARQVSRRAAVTQTRAVRG